MTMTKHIKISGDIVNDDTALMYDFFGMDCTSPKKVNDILNDDDDPDVDTDNVEDVVVDIASCGGDVSAGSQIYTALRSYGGNVTVNVVGLAASSASVIAMAGNTVNMSPTAQLMIHKAWTVSEGNSDDMKHKSNVLSKIDESLSNAYVAKTGMKQSDILKMMQDETWMTAKDAVRLGFADSIMFDDEDVDDPDADTDDSLDQLQFAAAAHPIPQKDKVEQFLKMMKMVDFFNESTAPANKAENTKTYNYKSLTQNKINSLLND